MGNLARYTTSDLPELMDKIVKNSIGINDDYLDRFFNVTHTSNYPPFNLIQINNVESRLEVALAGFKKDDVKVYTEYGKLHVEGKQEDKETDGEFVHKDWPNVLSTDNGRSQTIRRLDPSALPMDSSPLNWEK